MIYVEIFVVVFMEYISHFSLYKFTAVFNCLLSIIYATYDLLVYLVEKSHKVVFEHLHDFKYLLECQGSYFGLIVDQTVKDVGKDEALKFGLNLRIVLNCIENGDHNLKADCFSGDIWTFDVLDFEEIDNSLNVFIRSGLGFNID